MKRVKTKIMACLLCVMVAVTFIPTIAFADANTGETSYPIAVKVVDVDGKTIAEKTVDLKNGSVKVKTGSVLYTGTNKKPDPRCIALVAEYVELADVLKQVNVGATGKWNVQVSAGSTNSDQLDISKLLGTRYSSRAWASAETYTDTISAEGAEQVPAVLALKSYHTNIFNSSVEYAECLGDINVFASKTDYARAPRFFYGQDISATGKDSDSLNYGNMGFNNVSNVDTITVTETAHEYANGQCKYCGGADPNEVQKVEDIIDAIPDEAVTSSNADRIAAAAAKARAAYSAVCRACKREVKNLSKLDIAESDVAAYINANKSIGKVSKIKLKRGKKKATVSWSAVAGAKGYQVYRSTKKKSGFKCVKTAVGNGTVKFVNSKLKKKKNYYYKVRAYKTVCGKTFYGAFSATKRVRTR